MSRLVCQRCGKCCNDLIQQDRGVLRGLSLMLEEIHLFTEELVKPYLGIGKRPHMTNFKVIAYQLASDSCPHLVENSCRRYDERPTSCRQFPFSLDLDAARALGLETHHRVGDLGNPSLDDHTGSSAWA